MSDDNNSSNDSSSQNETKSALSGKKSNKEQLAARRSTDAGRKGNRSEVEGGAQKSPRANSRRKEKSGKKPRAEAKNPNDVAHGIPRGMRAESGSSESESSDSSDE